MAKEKKISSNRTPSTKKTKPISAPSSSPLNPDALALSFPRNDDEPVPLVVCYPAAEKNSSSSPVRRRSSRFTTNKFSTSATATKEFIMKNLEKNPCISPKPLVVLPALSGKTPATAEGRRRSPRLVSAMVEVEDKDKSINLRNSEDSRKTAATEGARRSPRLVLATPEGKSVNSRKSVDIKQVELSRKNQKKVPCISPKPLLLLPASSGKTPATVEGARRSPRLLLATAEVEGKGKTVNSRKSEGIKQVESSSKRKNKNNEDELIKTEDKNGSKKIKLTEMDETRKSKSPNFDSRSTGAKLELLALPEESAWTERASSKKCGTKRELLALLTPEGSKNSSASKKRASRGNDSVNVGQNSRGSRRKDPVFAELPVTSESNSVGEKTLRSRRIQGSSNNNNNSSDSAEKSERKQKSNLSFIGEPIPAEEAQEKWQWRYDLKNRKTQRQGWKLNSGEEDEIILNVECHYAQAKVAGFIFNIGDCAYVKGEGKKKHIGKILEFFKTTEGEDYFRVQWFFRAEDTVLKGAASFHDPKRIFYSTLENDNLLDCIVSKVNVIELSTKHSLDKKDVPPAHFYYDMEYCVDYSTFRTLHNVDASYKPITTYPLEVSPSCEPMKVELSLLDLYAGCGGMSMGLCLGTKLSGLKLVTKWAVDFNRSACDSLKLNHPQTHVSIYFVADMIDVISYVVRTLQKFQRVRNEGVEDFLELLKRWEELIKLYGCSDIKSSSNSELDDKDEGENNDDSEAGSNASSGEYEVLRLVDICYGDPNNKGNSGLYFKVRWKGYSSSEDTWEPIENLENCGDSIKDFVRRGQQLKILPLPGDVDMICGGPPCQGISGYNRHRNVDDPLSDEKNRQIIIFMDVVEFLRPKYVLMENVSDILRFDKASLGRYALSRLVHMRYQARLGTMAAGCYGLPQFRLRVFFWGALPSERLPPFPLPSHDVIVKYWPSPEFERNTVAYDEGQPRDLEEALVLRDAISDMPAVTWQETREEMKYEMPPETEFQKYIRLSKHEIMSCSSSGVKETKEPVLSDHRPSQFSEDDYLRVCLVPHRKGANFRDLPGVIVGEDNVARRDTKDPKVLPNGKPMVPDCALNFEQGKSKRPFARLWWDETVATLVTFPNHRAQAILHPEQDRVLTVREYARLQGFPDFYRFTGTLKQRYCQVGNAVAVPVGRALGYTLGLAYQRLAGNEPLIKLPPKFSFLTPPIDDIVVLQN